MTMVLKSPLERERAITLPRRPTTDIPESNVEGALQYLKNNGSGGLQALVDDPAPKLGADLDLNGHAIPGLADVASSGNYGDLTGTPTLGTAAAQDTSAFATAAQGAKADSAVQPGGLATVATTGSYNDLTDKPAGGGSGISALVEDTSPQLGGNLDLNGHHITGLQIGTDVQAYSANLDEWAAINPSTNGGSLVAAANYAAMRTLLDLEAGTDFYSISAADAAIAAAIAALVASSPSTLDTLNELAAALGDDPNFATTVSTNIGLKLAKASNLSDLGSATAALTNLGLSANGKSLVTAADYAAMRTLLGLVIGTNVQAYSATLTSWAGKTPPSGTVADTTDVGGQVDKSTDIVTYNSSQTAVLTDAGKTVEMNNASANTYTIPPNSSVAFPVNRYINVVQLGAGATTIVAGSGVTIRNMLGLKLAGQYAMASLYKRAADEWVAGGMLTT